MTKIAINKSAGENVTRKYTACKQLGCNCMHINLDKLQQKKTPPLPAAAFAQSLKLQQVC